ncbi:hypothetical protein AB7M42_002327 [Bradyrhizobium diazoefficiens]
MREMRWRLCFSEPGGAPVVANSNFNRPIEYQNVGCR